MTSSPQAPSALKTGFSNMSYQASEHVSVLKVVSCVYLYSLDPRWLYCVGVTFVIHQRDDTIVLSKLNLELPVSVSLVQACALGYDSLDLGLTLFLCLLIRRSRTFLSMQTILFIASIFQSLLETTTECRRAQRAIWRGCEKTVPEAVELIVLGLVGDG
jgi:hypothetical protein